VSETTSPWAQAAGQTATSAAPQANPVQPDLTPSRPLYDGRLGDLYAIYLRHVVLMLLTLGWSRFWGRTRIRRYLWSHMSIFGDRFEYRGRGRFPRTEHHLPLSSGIDPPPKVELDGQEGFGALHDRPGIVAHVGYDLVGHLYPGLAKRRTPPSSAFCMAAEQFSFFRETRFCVPGASRMSKPWSRSQLTASS